MRIFKAILKGLSLAAIFEDVGVSGGTSLATRPAGAHATS
jgi:hypothetical protein